MGCWHADARGVSPSQFQSSLSKSRSTNFKTFTKRSTSSPGKQQARSKHRSLLPAAYPRRQPRGRLRFTQVQRQPRCTTHGLRSSTPSTARINPHRDGSRVQRTLQFAVRPNRYCSHLQWNMSFVPNSARSEQRPEAPGGEKRAHF